MLEEITLLSEASLSTTCGGGAVGGGEQLGVTAVDPQIMGHKVEPVNQKMDSCT